MSQSSKRAANPGSSPPPNATKRPRGENAKGPSSAGGADAAKPPEKTDAGDALSCDSKPRPLRRTPADAFHPRGPTADDFFAFGGGAFFATGAFFGFGAT